jgi:hypothetical protein
MMALKLETVQVLIRWWISELCCIHVMQYHGR